MFVPSAGHCTGPRHRVAFTEAAADAALEEAQLAREAGRPWREERSKYKCEDCGYWHLSVAEPRKARAVAA